MERFRSVVHQWRPASPRGNPEREMRGVGNLTRATYANQRMTLILKIGKI